MKKIDRHRKTKLVLISKFGPSIFEKKATDSEERDRSCVGRVRNAADEAHGLHFSSAKPERRREKPLAREGQCH